MCFSLYLFLFFLCQCIFLSIFNMSPIYFTQLYLCIILSMHLSIRLSIFHIYPFPLPLSSSCILSIYLLSLRLSLSLSLSSSLSISFVPSSIHLKKLKSCMNAAPRLDRNNPTILSLSLALLFLSCSFSLSFSHTHTHTHTPLSLSRSLILSLNCAPSFLLTPVNSSHACPTSSTPIDRNNPTMPSLALSSSLPSTFPLTLYLSLLPRSLFLSIFHLSPGNSSHAWTTSNTPTDRNNPKTPKGACFHFGSVAHFNQRHVSKRWRNYSFTFYVQFGFFLYISGTSVLLLLFAMESRFSYADELFLVSPH